MENVRGPGQGPWWPANAIRARPPLERQTQRAEGREEAAATPCPRPSPAVNVCRLHHPTAPPPAPPAAFGWATAAARARGARGAARFIPGGPPPATPAPAANRSPGGHPAGSQGRAAQSVRPVLRGSGHVCSSNECRLSGSVACFPRGPCRPSADRSSPQPPALSSFHLGWGPAGGAGGPWARVTPCGVSMEVTIPSCPVNAGAGRCSLPSTHVFTRWSERDPRPACVSGDMQRQMSSPAAALRGPQPAARVGCERGIRGSWLSEAQALQCCRRHETRTAGDCTSTSEILASWGEGSLEGIFLPGELLSAKHTPGGRVCA